MYDQLESLMPTEARKEILNLESFKSLTLTLIEKNKSKNLIITHKQPVENDLIQTIKQFKKVFPFIRLVMILKEFSLDNIISLTEAGADYVLDYGMDMNERANKIAKITNEPALKFMPRMQFADLVINPISRKVSRSGTQIKLRRKEFELVEFLVKNPYRVITRTELLEVVWGYSPASFSNTVDVHMASLRRKIDRGFKIKLIQTVHGKGYMLQEN
jgi:DNA-binding response OmpR family regulator